MTVNSDEIADLAGPGVSTYEEVAKILPTDYKPLLSPSGSVSRARTCSCSARRTSVR